MEIRGCFRRFIHTKDADHLKDIYRILKFKFLKRFDDRQILAMLLGLFFLFGFVIPIIKDVIIHW